MKSLLTSGRGEEAAETGFAAHPVLDFAVPPCQPAVYQHRIKRGIVSIDQPFNLAQYPPRRLVVAFQTLVERGGIYHHNVGPVTKPQVPGFDAVPVRQFPG